MLMDVVASIASPIDGVPAEMPQVGSEAFEEEALDRRQRDPRIVHCGPGIEAEKGVFDVVVEEVDDAVAVEVRVGAAIPDREHGGGPEAELEAGGLGLELHDGGVERQ